MEDQFNLFESQVLPLLSKYNGTLLYRVRPAKEMVIANSIGSPYEIHLVAFPTDEDFKAYSSDPERQQFLHLKEASVEKVMLIKGTLL